MVFSEFAGESGGWPALMGAGVSVAGVSARGGGDSAMAGAVRWVVLVQHCRCECAVELAEGKREFQGRTKEKGSRATPQLRWGKNNEGRFRSSNREKVRETTRRPWALQREGAPLGSPAANDEEGEADEVKVRTAVRAVLAPNAHTDRPPPVRLRSQSPLDAPALHAP